MSTLRSESATPDGPSGSPQYKYWAFVSYSHADRKWADWLHKSLETFRVPQRLQGQQVDAVALPKRLFPLFIDRAELPVASDLHQNVKVALEDSKHLIVICSPHSAESRWVNEEVRLFKAMGRESRILCLIVGGEPNAADKKLLPDSECFAPALKFRVRADGAVTEDRVEPIAADVRPGAGNKRDALLKIAAGLIGVSFDSLKRREQERRTRQLAGLAGVLTAAATIFCLLALSALRGQNEARRAYSNNLLNQAVGLIGQGKTAEAVAYLAQSVRLSRDNLVPRTMLLAQLEAAGTLSEYLPAEYVWDSRLSEDKGTLSLLNTPTTIRCMNPLTGQAKGTALQMSDTVHILAISANGEYLLAATHCSVIVAATAGTTRFATSTPELGHGERWSESGVNCDGSGALLRALDTASGQITGTYVWAANESALVRVEAFDRQAVCAARFTPNGDLAIIAEGNVRIWNPRTQKQVWMRSLGSPIVNHLALSPDGRTLVASGGQQAEKNHIGGPGVFEVLDLGSGKQSYSRATKIDSVVEFSPDGRLLLPWEGVVYDRAGREVFRKTRVVRSSIWSPCWFSGSSRFLAWFGEEEAGSLILADVDTKSTMVIPGAAGVGGSVVTESGRVFAYTGEHGLRVWDATSRHALSLGTRLQSKVDSLQPLADGVSVMTAATPRQSQGSRCELQFWRYRPPRGRAYAGAGNSTGATHSPDGQRLALRTCSVPPESCHHDTCDRLDVLDLSQGAKVLSTIVQSDGIQPWGTCWCAGGQRLAVVSGAGRASVYDANTGAPVPITGLSDHKTRWAGVDSTGNRLVIAGEDSFSVWDMNSGSCVVGPVASGSRISWATLSRDGRAVVLGCSSAVLVYNAETGRPLVEDRRSRSSDVLQTLSQDGRLLVVYTYFSGLERPSTDTIRVWDLHTGKQLGSKPVRGTRSASISPDGDRMAIVLQDSLQVWTAGFSARILGPVRAPSIGPRFSSSGSLLLWGRWNGTVVATSAKTGLAYGRPIPAAGSMPVFVPHRRDEWLFVTRDSAAYLVDIRTGLALAGPFPADGRVSWLYYAPNGVWLAVFGWDGQVRLYDVSACELYPDRRLPDLAEAIVGMRMGPLGVPEEAPHASDTRTSLRAFYGMKKDPYSRWAFSLLGGEPDPVQPHR